MLKFNLERLLIQRGITKPVPFLIKAGFTRNVASRIVNLKPRKYSAKQIETLCKVLKCMPNDLFEWTPDSPDEINNNNPLCKLIRSSGPVVDFRNFSSEIPLERLPDFAKKIEEIKKEFLS